MKTRLIRIGGSRGPRLPKRLIEQAGLTDEVEIEVCDKAIVILAHKRPRAGWAAAARALHEKKGDRLLDEPTPTAFEQNEWQ